MSDFKIGVTPFIKGPTFTGLKSAMRSSNEKLLGIQSTGALLTVMDTSSAGVESTDWTKSLDISSYSYGAKIKLTNAGAVTRTISEVTVRGAPVIQLQGEEGIIHDALRDNGDIFENGERRIDWGNDSIVSTTQAEKVADYLWKDYGSAKHLYVLDLPGTRYDLEPDDWYNLEIGGAGQIEYIDSSVRVMSVETERGAAELGRTRLVLREVEEAWKNDSNAVARFIASGSFNGSPSSQSTITIGSQYYTGKADVYCDGTADQVEINAMIDLLSNTRNGGTVLLTDGTFKIDGVIAMKSGVHLSLDANATIEKNCNDHAIEAIGGSGTELTNVRITGGTITRNASDTDASSLVYLSYTDKSTVENVILNDAYAAGLYGNYCDGLIVTNVRVNEFGTGTGGGATYGMVFTYCENMGLTDCVIDGLSESKTTDLYGISIVESSCAFNGIQVSRLLTSGNTCGAYITSRNFATAGGTLLITDIESTGSTKTAYGILIDGMNGAIIQAVIDDIDNSGTAANSYGFYTEASLAAVDDNTITLNVTGCTGTGVLIEANSDRNIFIGRSTGNGTNITDGGSNTNTAAFDSN